MTPEPGDEGFVRVRRHSKTPPDGKSPGEEDVAEQRKLIKHVSMESHVEREISNVVLRAMQRQAREDREKRLRPEMERTPIGAQRTMSCDFGLSRFDSIRRTSSMGCSLPGASPEHDSDMQQRCVEGAEKDLGLLKASLRGLEIFDTLEEDALIALIDAMKVYSYEDGENAVRQGDSEGSHFFVVASGKFIVVKDGKPLIDLEPGQGFGESALLLFGERSATVRAAMGPARAYAIDGQIVRDMIRSSYEEGHEATTQAVDEVLASGSIEMLTQLNAYQLQVLYDRAELRVYKAGEVLFVEGDRNIDMVHVVLEGKLSLRARGHEVQTLGRLSTVGDRGIMFEQQPVTVVVEREVKTLTLKRELLNDMFGDQLHLVLMKSRILGILGGHKTLGRLNEDQREAVSACCRVITLQPNEELDGSDTRFVAVLFGEVQTSTHECEPDAGSPVAGDDVSPTSSIDFRRYSGNRHAVVGEEFLLNPDRAWNIRVRAVGPSIAKVAVWKGRDLDNVLCFDQLALDHDDKMRSLKSVVLFRTLSKTQLTQLAGALRVYRVNENESIIKQGSTGTHFYIIRSGRVLITKDDKKIRESSLNDYFGERALLHDELRSASVTASEACVLWVMDKATFLSTINGQILDYLQSRIALQDTAVTLADLDCVRIIGRGGFAVVKLVEARASGTRYALKCVRKRDVVEKGQQDSVVCERSILSEVDHPFIIKFVRSFKCSQFVYILQELVSHGELLDALDTLGLLKHEHAQFYTSSIILALEFLHARRIAYLDLKSENILVDHQGYLKIIDFGIAQRITSARCHVVKGTPTFMAPEMILMKGYNTAADMWSLGICLYEFVFGEFPFAKHCTNTVEIFQEVIKAELHYPAWFAKHPHMAETKAIIEGLLTRDPAKRLGASCGGYATLQAHDFFKGFSWDDLLGRKLEPPHIPKAETYAEDKEGEDGEVIQREPLDVVVKRENEEQEAAYGWVDPEPGWDAEF